MNIQMKHFTLMLLLSVLPGLSVNAQEKPANPPQPTGPVPPVKPGKSLNQLTGRVPDSKLFEEQTGKQFFQQAKDGILLPADLPRKQPSELKTKLFYEKEKP